MFVIDTSAMMPWVFDDESHPVAVASSNRAVTEDMVAPALWWFELRNALVMGERRKRITPEQTGSFLRRLARLGVIIDRSPDEPSVLDFARRHRLTVYDAAYLELAQRKAIDLATLDADLAKAACTERVGLVTAPL